MARPNQHTIRLAFECETVALVHAKEGEAIIPYTDEWKMDLEAHGDIALIPAVLLKLGADGAVVHAGGQTFTLPEWRAVLRKELAFTGGDELNLQKEQNNTPIFLRSAALYQCQVSDPRPPPHTWTSYPEFYLRVENSRPPFTGTQWKVFPCRVERLRDESDLLREVDRAAPMDLHAAHFSPRLLREDLQLLHQHALKLQEERKEEAAANASTECRSDEEVRAKFPNLIMENRDMWEQFEHEENLLHSGYSGPPGATTTSHNPVTEDTARTVPYSISGPSAAAAGQAARGGAASGRVSPKPATALLPKLAGHPLVADAVWMLEQGFHASDRPKSWWVDLFHALGDGYPSASDALRRVRATD